MEEYIVDEEQQLSPIVIVMTGVLAAAFAVGLLYQLVGFVI